MAENFIARLTLLPLIAPAILIAITFHEFAHGGVAYLFGDPTAKNHQRLTLNPLKHLDLAGTILFVLVGFGWGKPVPVDGRYFRHPRRDMLLVSLAGPVTNFILAAIFGLLYRLAPGGGYLAALLQAVVWINIVLAVFNLIPLPPLDGSGIVSAILPAGLHARYEAVQGYGIAIIFALVVFFPGVFDKLIGPFINFFAQLFL
jgi:Zn-dependent protease